VNKSNQIRFISGNIWPIETSRKTVNNLYKDRQTDRHKNKTSVLTTHRAREKTIEMLGRGTPDFISPLQWPPNSPNLKPVEYAIWGPNFIVQFSIPLILHFSTGYMMITSTKYY